MTTSPHRRLIRAVWLLSAFGIILFAFLVSVFRLLSPLLNDYRADLLQVMSEQLGRPVQAQSVAAEWVGWRPRLHLQQVRIAGQDGRDEWLSFQEIEIGFGFWTLLARQEVDPTRIVLRGAQLQVRQLAEQEFEINGEKIELHPDALLDQDAMLHWLLARDHVELDAIDLSWEDVRDDKQDIELQSIHLVLQGEAPDYHLYGQLHLPEQPEETLSFVMDLQGDLRRLEQIQHRFHIAGNLQVAPWLQRHLLPWVKLHSGNMQLRLWGAGKFAQLSKLTLKLDANDFVWSVRDPALPDTPARLNHVQDLSGELFWRRRDNGWNLSVEDLRVTHQGREWPESFARLRYREIPPETGSNMDGGPQVDVEGEVGFLRLQDLSALVLRNLPAREQLRQEIQTLDLRGDLQRLVFRYRGQRQEAQDFYLSTRFDGLGFQRWRSLPGASGLDGDLVMDARYGVMHLRSRDTVLDFGDLFREPLHASQLQGDLYWARNATGWVLQAQRIEARNPNIETLSRLRVDLFQNDPYPFIDLQVDFRKGDGASAVKYLPRRVMHPNVVHWLDMALVEGYVPKGRMLYHGHVNEFPFTEGRGVFDVEFDVQRMTLQYAQDWPTLKQANANVHFHGKSLDVRFQSGDVHGLKLQESTAHIADLGVKAELDLALHLQGPTEAMFGYLQDSPAGVDYREFLDGVRASGASHLDLELRLPLLHPGDYGLQGRMDFDNSRLTLRDWQRTLTELRGGLEFTRRGSFYWFNTRDLQGRYEGVPASLQAETRLTGDQHAETRVRMRSRLAPQVLAPEATSRLEGTVHGEADWDVSLLLTTPGKARLHDARLEIRSDLKGVSIDLPDGFYKHKDDARELQIDIELLPEGVGKLQARYGDRVQSVIQLAHEGQELRLDRGHVHLGTGEAQLPERAGLRITGTLPELHADAWLGLVGVKPGAGGAPWLQEASVRIGKLHTGNYAWNDVALQVTPATGEYGIQVESRELKGRIIVPYAYDNQRPVLLQLQQLTLALDRGEKAEQVLDPRDLPPMNVQCDRLVLDDKEFGTLRLQAEHIEQGTWIRNLELVSPVLNITGSGSWTVQQSWHLSRFEIKASSRQIGNALALWNYNAGIDGEEAKVEINAKWSGPPHWFEMKRLDGNVYMSVRKGQLRDVDPGSGRVFGLLSMHSLPRRLTLDFTDLFKKGLGFDRIEGHFAISEGDAYTNDLYLDGPAVHIDIAGRIGLATQDYDQVVYVQPKVSSSIPVIGGLAGGPQVALGLLLTERVFGGRINKMSAIRYNVTGSWDRPVVTRVNNGEADKAPAPKE